MELAKIRIAKSGLTETVYAGYLSKDGTTWKQKVDVTNDFFKAVIDWWEGNSQKIVCENGDLFEITVLKIKAGA